MAKSKSSHRWLKEHFDDMYVQKARKEGYRSRAVYKLDEIQQKDRIFKPSQYVLDLGAAPGGWSQYAVKHIGKKGRVIATDILPMDSIPFVEFVQGDFREDAVLEKLLQLIDNKPLDLVISDIAPNMSGMGAVDQPRAMYLCELALDMAKQVLRPGGSFVTKLFQGEGADEFIKQVRQQFQTVKIRKPKASRPRSREVYILGLNFKKNG